jgi:hypothetical protein
MLSQLELLKSVLHAPARLRPFSLGHVSAAIHICSQSATAVSYALCLVCSTAKEREPVGGRGVTGTSANAMLALEQKIAAARMMSRI